MRALLRRLWLRFSPQYRRLEFGSFSYEEADRLIRESADKPEAERWMLAEEEDHNRFGAGLWVYLQRRERIWQ